MGWGRQGSSGLSSYGAFVERNTGQKVFVVICQGVTPVIPQLQAPTGVREIQLEGLRGWLISCRHHNCRIRKLSWRAWGLLRGTGLTFKGKSATHLTSTRATACFWLFFFVVSFHLFGFCLLTFRPALVFPSPTDLAVMSFWMLFFLLSWQSDNFLLLFNEGCLQGWEGTWVLPSLASCWLLVQCFTPTDSAASPQGMWCLKSPGRVAGERLKPEKSNRNILSTWKPNQPGGWGKD